MKLWIKVIRGHKIIRDTVFAQDGPSPARPEEWSVLLSEALKPMDLSAPVILTRHVRDLETFQRAVFRETDFMERIDFDRLDVEILPEEKRKANVKEVLLNG